jgi:hypothetical protein
MALVLSVILIPALGLAGIGPTQAQPLQVSPVPIWGIVLGTIIVAGLLYLIVHGPDGGYYRYPYYGEYYGYYYRPHYRPYTGFYLASAPIIIVAPKIAGVVLGIVVVDHLQYILTRDAYGHQYRYPYYGPYHQFYYRPTYRPYTGAFHNAPVRQGDHHWDTDKRNLAPAFQRPQPHERPSPAYHQPQQQPYPSQHGGGGNSGESHNPQQKCGHPQEPPCPNNGQHP